MIPTFCLFFFRGHPPVVSKFSDYLQVHSNINLSILTYYEIVSGLKHRDAHKQPDSFIQFAKANEVLPISSHAADVAAEKYAQLRRIGQSVDDIDLLIAGIAITNKLTLVTNNLRHFERITGLSVVSWAD